MGKFLKCPLLPYLREIPILRFNFPRTILRALVMQTIQGFVNPVTILPRILQSCGRPENRKLEK